MTEQALETRGIIPPKPELLLAVNELRAREIAGVLYYLFEKKLLNRDNLAGRVVDIGTGSGAGVVALEALGARDVVGVDHIDIHNGVNVKELLGQRFVHKTAAAYLRSLPDSTLGLITAFNANISLVEFFPEAVRMLTAGGQILVTTNAPESVSYLGGGILLNVEEDWQKLPIGATPIAQRETFGSQRLSFAPSHHCPNRDRYFFIETKRGTE